MAQSFCALKPGFLKSETARGLGKRHKCGVTKYFHHLTTNIHVVARALPRNAFSISLTVSLQTGHSARVNMSNITLLHRSKFIDRTDSLENIPSTKSVWNDEIIKILLIRNFLFALSTTISIFCIYYFFYFLMSVAKYILEFWNNLSELAVNLLG